MADVRVKLLRPLNGGAIGSESTYSKADAERLASTGAVKILGEAKAEAPPAEKAEPPVANKAETITSNKAKPK